MKLPLLVLLFLFSQAAFCNPQNPEITSGWAHLENAADSLVVTTGDKTIINWQSFSIGPKEITKFMQPNSKAVVLNRVVDVCRSEIFGRLEANGRIFLINPYGILVGENAVIKTASFLASSLDIHDRAFEENDLHFMGFSQEAVVNFGRIEAWDGDVQLIGKVVENHGQINAKNGTAALVATSELLLIPTEDQPFYLRPYDEGEDVSAIIARLKKEGNPYQNAFHHKRTADALQIVEEEGNFYLEQPSYLKVSGSVAAKNDDGSGGEIYLLGDEIDLVKGSLIDVSHDSGGGEILIGGDFQGRNPALFPNLGIFVEKGAKIKADATDLGHGGKVILWSNGFAAFHGSVSSKGGPEGGNGGLVQVVGLRYLRYRGNVNINAPLGDPGIFLMAPTIINLE